MDFPRAERPGRIERLWTRKLSGIITDLSVSRDGSAVLVASAPNFEIEGGATRPALERYGSGGKLTWRIEPSAAIKSIALTDDGRMALVASYENEITALGASGKVLWSIEATCKPVPVRRRWICYHDDDPEAGVAFDVYDEKGNKILFYPSKQDILGLKVSDDQRYTVIALEGGNLLLFGPEFETLWQRKVDGEIIDLAVSSGPEPKVSALYSPGGFKSSEGAQKVAVFDTRGQSLGEAGPEGRLEQVEMAPDGRGFGLYGNDAEGQGLAFFALPAQKRAKTVPRAWGRGSKRPADYSSSITMTRNQVIMGYEDLVSTARHSHLLGFDFQGGLKWDLPLRTEEGAYLYAHGFAPETSLLVVGTDDGNLSAFKLQEAE